MQQSVVYPLSNFCLRPNGPMLVQGVEQRRCKLIKSVRKESDLQSQFQSGASSG